MDFTPRTAGRKENKTIQNDEIINDPYRLEMEFSASLRGTAEIEEYIVLIKGHIQMTLLK